MNNWELAFGILGIVLALIAATAIVLLLVFGTTRRKRTGDEGVAREP